MVETSIEQYFISYSCSRTHFPLLLLRNPVVYTLVFFSILSISIHQQNRTSCKHSLRSVVMIIRGPICMVLRTWVELWLLKCVLLQKGGHRGTNIFQQCWNLTWGRKGFKLSLTILSGWKQPEAAYMPLCEAPCTAVSAHRTKNDSPIGILNWENGSGGKSWSLSSSSSHFPESNWASAYLQTLVPQCHIWLQEGHRLICSLGLEWSRL